DPSSPPQATPPKPGAPHSSSPSAVDPSPPVHELGGGSPVPSSDHSPFSEQPPASGGGELPAAEDPSSVGGEIIHPALRFSDPSFADPEDFPQDGDGDDDEEEDSSCASCDRYFADHDMLRPLECGSCQQTVCNECCSVPA